MNTCFNCGTRYNNDTFDENSTLNYALTEGFCSIKCMDQDNARLVEGNGIIEAAEKQEVGFTDINKLKLDTNMPLAAKALQELKSKSEQDKQQLNNLLGFNRKQDVNDNEPDDAA